MKIKFEVNDSMKKNEKSIKISELNEEINLNYLKTLHLYRKKEKKSLHEEFEHLMKYTTEILRIVASMDGMF